MEPADPDTTIRPEAAVAREAVGGTSAVSTLTDLHAAILRYLRHWPNQTVELGPLADQLNVPDDTVQLAAERLAQRGLLVTPFIEPGRAGAGTLTAKGLRWLLQREGGTPADVPVAFQKADKPVRAADEAARLPRAQVYGIRRDS